MTPPKEKAKELVEKFRLNVLDYEGCGINEHKAKQCALIAVEEILNALLVGDVDIWDRDQIEYWYEVKLEIENI